MALSVGVVVAIVVLVGVRSVNWLNSSQKNCPTNKIVLPKFVYIPNIFCGGASTSPPNPIVIGGGVADH
jgi:hypothetical protein